MDDGGQQGYEPMMSQERAMRLRRWHDDSLAGGKRRGTVTVEALGWTLVVPADVYPPHPLGLADLVLREVTEEDRVLDMGTGSGVNALAAATRSREVIAVDVDPNAVDAAAANAVRNGLVARITIRVSDIFELRSDHLRPPVPLVSCSHDAGAWNYR